MNTSNDRPAHTIAELGVAGGPCLIDGFGPVPVSSARSVAALGELVRGAASQGAAVYPLGGRTLLGFGLPPNRPGIAIDLTGLRDVVDYPARDMTITVEAGVTIAELQATLLGEQQRLPVDVPLADRATLGGAVACNLSGPRRYGFGTFRDYVIGITVVDAAGRAVKGGGRVVKNVAGYDLCKLYTGSLGTLGVIAQLTLKLRPLPEASALSWIVLPDADRLRTVLDGLVSSATRPVAIDVLCPSAATAVARRAGPALTTGPYDLDTMLRLRAAFNPTGRCSPAKMLPTAGACIEVSKAERKAAV